MKRCGFTKTAATVSAVKRSASGEEDFQTNAAMPTTTIALKMNKASETCGQGSSSDQKDRRECIWIGARLSSAASTSREMCPSASKYACITPEMKYIAVKANCVPAAITTPATHF